ncbi:putative topoisomerase ii protein [Phaeoacremonium minimum UCRPA7]|uniref:Putative topoisomerase ii protein n=1 Tax=Phaeoacremonium minimum (strain UCR-PA7) TaxID=1286976 RepID=R8BAL3_PHAM7|nr:putative topoisomerase ii protein [Phaeoacremonium minimum UCRPA7]EON96331.1 putative topoisomerase ii protein [Phaeoacremonium minimum UCRPA7]
MSFFNLDPSHHNQAAPGFSQAHDPWAGLSNRNDNADDGMDFEETYDGLGDQLDETDDAFNDDTFGGGGGGSGGGGGPAPGSVGKDFDFFGQTAKVANAIEEEHLRFNRQQPASRAVPSGPAVHAGSSSYHYAPQYVSQPARTGYEKYKGPEPGMDLQVDAALWGVAPKKPTVPAPVPVSQPQQVPVAASRKMMSLEEVEAAMRAQSQPKKQSDTQPLSTAPSQPRVQSQQTHHYQTTDYYAQRPESQGPPPPEAAQPHGHGHPVTILQRPQSKSKQPPPPAPQPGSPMGQSRQQAAPPVQPTQILQNPNRLSGDAARIGVPTHPTHRQQNSVSRQTPIITHPSQVSQLSEEEKAAYLEQEAKRAKRNHKIYLLSRDNGIMTPQDKNFVTRIQLQQLVSATGNPNDHGTDEALAEDFYYQVHNQIRGGQRQHPSQPLNNFAQTYLYQTGSRHNGPRRYNRGAENHMQRMEQQVQRAVEAAKNKPKNSQLVIEGSLGKISFSNAKTPKPLLNIKRSESGDVHRHKTHANEAGIDRKTVLQDIEKVYSTLMKMEDHDRKMPPPVKDESDTNLIQEHVEWGDAAQRLNSQLWRELKVHEPLGATPVHPFIAFLTFAKGKKAIPRVFRHTTHEQRTTILTMIIVHLDQLDVIRKASITEGQISLNAAMRENIELFSLAVVQTLFNFMSELDLDIVSGVLGLISTLNVDLIAKTRIGVSVLTMILSRAEIIRQSGGGNEQSWKMWESTYTNFFNIIEPSLPHIFPGTVISGEDVYVWQLLAALGIGANPDQQQRLVLGVKDRVMETVAIAKSLPPDLSAQRLSNVNLFMRSIGLDVELLG